MFDEAYFEQDYIANLRKPFRDFLFNTGRFRVAEELQGLLEKAPK